MTNMTKVCVAEMFYQQFLADNQSGTSLMGKLQAAVPTKRGRGFTRTLENLSHDEWNELYQHAAVARSRIQGPDNVEQLRGAICAKSLTTRMEEFGSIDNPVLYTPQRQSKPIVKAEPDDRPDIPLPTVDQTVDSDEMSDDELGAVGQEVVNG